MFIGLEFRESDNTRYFEQLNITHITRLSFINVKNPDAGTVVHLRTGETLKTPVPMDEITNAIDECWKEAASVLLITIIRDKLNLSTIRDSESSFDSGPLPE